MGFQSVLMRRDYNFGRWREVIRIIDNKTCYLCGQTPIPLVVHHYDGNKTKNNPHNLFTLCYSCHNKVTFAYGINSKLLSPKQSMEAFRKLRDHPNAVAKSARAKFMSIGQFLGDGKQ